MVCCPERWGVVLTLGEGRREGGVPVCGTSSSTVLHVGNCCFAQARHNNRIAITKTMRQQQGQGGGALQQ